MREYLDFYNDEIGAGYYLHLSSHNFIILRERKPVGWVGESNSELKEVPLFRATGEYLFDQKETRNLKKSSLEEFSEIAGFEISQAFARSRWVRGEIKKQKEKEEA